MVGGTLCCSAGFSVAGGDVDFTADDGGDACIPGFAVEFPCAEHVAVVGESDSGNTVFDGPFNHVSDAAGTVEHAIFTLIV